MAFYYPDSLASAAPLPTGDHMEESQGVMVLPTHHEDANYHIDKLSTMRINVRGGSSHKVPGTRCPTCAAEGKEVWVIPGRVCGYCGTACDNEAPAL